MQHSRSFMHLLAGFRVQHPHSTIVKIPLFQVDAFTTQLFSGNPAAVCPLESWLSDTQMLSIAAENNVSETAFFVRQGNRYDLRWFSPASEVQLCGHATLATAFVIFNVLEPGAKSVCFQTCSGPLTIQEEDEHLVMSFPAAPPRTCAHPPVELISGLDPTPQTVLTSGHSLADRNYFVVYESEDQVRAARPNFALLEKLHPAGVCITAQGQEADFVSRYFVPSYGIPEDPVTGSTHCSLGPYWSARLGKGLLHARQLSRRGGEMLVEPRGDRVLLKGRAVLYLVGSIEL
jgi:PhzF family phenazine biosynthesis protein